MAIGVNLNGDLRYEQAPYFTGVGETGISRRLPEINNSIFDQVEPYPRRCQSSSGQLEFIIYTR